MQQKEKEKKGDYKKKETLSNSLVVFFV